MYICIYIYIYIYTVESLRHDNDNTNKTTSAGTNNISLVKTNGDQKTQLIDNKYWKG